MCFYIFATCVLSLLCGTSALQQVVTSYELNSRKISTLPKRLSPPFEKLDASTCNENLQHFQLQRQIQGYDASNVDTNSFEKCEKICLDNTACKGFQFGSLGKRRGGECITWYEPFCDDNDAWEYYRKVETETTPSMPSSSVCISLVAFEDAEWIDVLLTNIRTFTESSTKIAIHLDVDSEYDETRMRAWESSSSTVTPTRVHPAKFKGGILYAHLLNAKALENKWPHQCAYYVLQASNQMWVRPGMEQFVWENKISPRSKSCWQCNKPPIKTDICDHPVFQDLIRGDYSKASWSPPEGLFMPMDMVLDFVNYLDEWISRNNWDVEEKIIKMNGHVEEFWLQTWAESKATDVPPVLPDSGFLSFRTYMEGDYVSMEQLESVMSGGTSYHAVKRIQRDVDDPVTKYITLLSTKLALEKNTVPEQGVPLCSRGLEDPITNYTTWLAKQGIRLCGDRDQGHVADSSKKAPV